MQSVTVIIQTGRVTITIGDQTVVVIIPKQSLTLSAEAVQNTGRLALAPSLVG